MRRKYQNQASISLVDCAIAMFWLLRPDVEVLPQWLIKVLDPIMLRVKHHDLFGLDLDNLLRCIGIDKGLLG